MSPVIIELKTDAEWRAGASVLLSLRPNLDVPSFIARRPQLEADGYRFIGVSVEGALVSVASFTLSPHAVLGRELLIHDMATREEARGKAHATRLLRYMEEIARASGCGRIFVHTKSAAEFYGRNGFERYSTGLTKTL